MVSGIPANIEHEQLEGIFITLFNSVCPHNINSRDIIACHRISLKSASVLVKFVNKKDATSLLNSRKTIDGLNNDSIDLGYCTKFYVEEHLTPYVSLSYKCRCLKRRNLIIKTKNQKGTVKILKNFDGGTIKWVKFFHS